MIKQYPTLIQRKSNTLPINVQYVSKAIQTVLKRQPDRTIIWSNRGGFGWIVKGDMS